MFPILFAIIFWVSSPAFAFEMPLEGVAGQSNPKIVVNGAGTYLDDGSVQNEKISIGVPVWKTEESSISIGARNHQFTLSRDLTLPDSSVIVPKSLKSTEFTLGYSTKLAEGASAGGRIMVGSSSDRPFTGSRVSSLGGSIFWSFPARHNPQGRWILSLNYSNNNSFTTLPIPGIAYLLTEPGLIGVFGLPFVYVRWVPVEGGPWTLSVFNLITLLKLEAAYGPPFMNLFFRLETNQDTWLRADREFVEDRLMYEEKTASFGGRMPLAKWLFAEARVGYAVDRQFSEGKSMFDKRTGNASLEDGWFYSADLRASF